MPVAAMLAGAGHQGLDLALGEGAPVACQVFDGWSPFSEPRFHRNKTPILEAYWLSYTPSLDSHKGRIGRIKRIGSAMRDGGVGGGASRVTGVRGGPPGGTFRFQIFIKGSSPEI